jgi:hypothetical protein
MHPIPGGPWRVSSMRLDAPFATPFFSPPLVSMRSFQPPSSLLNLPLPGSRVPGPRRRLAGRPQVRQRADAAPRHLRTGLPDRASGEWGSGAAGRSCQCDTRRPRRCSGLAAVGSLGRMARFAPLRCPGHSWPLPAPHSPEGANQRWSPAWPLAPPQAGPSSEEWKALTEACVRLGASGGGGGGSAADLASELAQMPVALLMEYCPGGPLLECEDAFMVRTRVYHLESTALGCAGACSN